MAQPKTIAVVTGTRAEFGLLEPVMSAIQDHPELTLRLIVTGTHLTTESARDIEQAGFTIDAQVAMQHPGEHGRRADSEALGRGIVGMSQRLAQMRPDWVLVLGDRIEAFAAASAASVGGIHLAHIHGGDRAQGIADEALRHAISKLAHLHMAATAASRRRLIRMGEDAERVIHVGSPAIDGLSKVEPAGDGPQLIVLSHPVGDDDASEAQRTGALLDATASYTRTILGPNHDPGRAGVMRALAQESVTTHLPRRRFLELLAGAKAIVGNSSAGLIEAAALGTPAVNLGLRQAGRERPASVIDCPDDRSPRAIKQAIDQALALDLRQVDHPYGHGQAGLRIAQTLASIDLDSIPIKKRNRY